MKSLSPYFLILFVAAWTGCISHQETVYRDVSRVSISFENDKAARLFYESLSLIHSDQREESKTEIHVPVVFEHKRNVVTGDNERFNKAVAECDTNRDAKITESEAEIFANQHKCNK